MIKYCKAKERNNQAEVYRRITNEGIQCCLEVEHDGNRFDVVVYDDKKKAVCIVEVKHGKSNRKQTEPVKKQIQRYEQYGLPVYFVHSTDTLNLVCAEIIKLHGVCDPVEDTPEETSIEIEWPLCCCHP